MPEINILQNIRNKQKLELRRSIVAALKFESKLGGGRGRRLYTSFICENMLNVLILLLELARICKKSCPTHAADYSIHFHFKKYILPQTSANQLFQTAPPRQFQSPVSNVNY